ncbi:receptor protein-tyrosine kinase CEPR1 isoform X2 [Brachypodium distachyon]|nr:receptor protein-tyrosine kinase CEPR1 isoform X2 [Brachypodium distachyon]KQJ95354.1 hypothetical protein BRADI_3g16730v3 [Brachypodium distachyon]KQJ95355.1 hypothetical protein BRADI_3g16730v3 [Brachypodium distachyon]PNT66756.1 hypothetical protein BRADI_3g16730v3 [Brachypodium distachyon]|eukprot:XP_024318003.1 receptor protein-tyrosine kinase CEPR1 isoform X2 [Brachypodium distachyon]
MNPGRHFSLRACFGLGNGSGGGPVIYNEQDILDNLGDAEVISSINIGGIWTSVLYRVELQDTSRVVVVKKLQNERGSTVDASLNDRCQSEVNLLESIGHDNIISLAGCIPGDDSILLVYDHKENGSLNQWLHPDPPQLAAQGVLGWPTRRAIAIGAAQGLCCLHHGRNHPIVHHNINSTNILLDTGLKPKITGFDLARINLAGPDQPVPIWELTAANMVGYTAPEYLTVGATAKVDVYSFGVVLLGLVTGRVAYEPIEDGHLAAWAGTHCNRLMENTGDFSGVVDMAIPHRARYLKEMAAMFKLGVDCTVREPQERPSMHEVLYRLRNRGR